MKREIVEELRNKRAMDIEYNRCRLRKKNYKNPSRPYLDDATFEDLTNPWELFLQVLPGEEPLTNPNQTLVFVRQWCPTTLEFKHFQEIVLDTKEVSECIKKVGRI